MKKTTVKYCIAGIACIFIAAGSGCKNTHIKNPGVSLQFAVISNTAPESPYKGYHPDAKKLIDALNRENPTLVIHAGNMIYAGNSPGLRDVDVIRQVNDHKTLFSKLNPICNYAAGDLDHFKGSSSFNEMITGKNAFYSFHYGTVHFLIINSTDPQPGLISSARRKWIAEELEYNKNDDAIIVISHHPFFLQKNIQGSIPCVENPEELHQLFVRYGVTAVLSGAGDYCSRTARDGIDYINAGCIPVFRKDGYDQFRYYTANLSGGKITVTGRKL
ncbi:MAG: metallophosphoesterase family protein [Spirochaetota bacterium]